MSMKDRMNDAAFTIQTHLCSICKNKITRKTDDKNPRTTRPSCRKYGEIPDDIYRQKTYDCEGLEIDKGKFAREAPFLPGEVRETLKGKLLED